MKNSTAQIVTVTLNPTIDRVLEVPGLQIGQHCKGQLRWREPAGKALNVSRALLTLGIRSTAVGLVGRGELAEFETFAKAAGFLSRFTPIAGASRENITLIDPVANTETHIRDVGPHITRNDLERLRDRLAGFRGPQHIVVFTGSLPPGLEPEDFGKLLEQCIGQRTRVAVDTSGAALKVAATHQLWLLKPNRQELCELANRQDMDLNAIGKFARFLSTSIEHVVVTLGPQGAIATTANRSVASRCPIDAARVVSTVGCGDTFLAGYLAMASSSANPETALATALAAATASAMNPRPAVFTREQFNALLPCVEPF